MLGVRSVVPGQRVARAQKSHACSTRAPCRRWVQFHAAYSTPPKQQSRERVFQNRSHEQRQMNALLDSMPVVVSLLLGPSSSGKSTLLQQVARLRKMSGKGGMCIIDGRSCDISTPAGLVHGLAQHVLAPLLQHLQQLQPGILDHVRMGSAIAAAAGAELQQAAQARGASRLPKSTTLGQLGLSGSDLLDFLTCSASPAGPCLNTALAALQEVLKLWAQQRVPCAPTLVIDGAGLLMGWSSSHPAELGALARFMQLVTMQDHSSHVVLAASDSLFQDWCHQQIGADRCHAYVIGYLPEADARALLDQELGRYDLARVGDSDWGEVWEVCGGDPHALSRLSVAFSLSGGWQEALKLEVRHVMASMLRASAPAETDGYTPQQYARAVQAICSSPYEAVCLYELQAHMHGTVSKGRQAVEAMLMARHLALRPYSEWSLDIVAEAFGPEQHPVVTAPSPVHLHVMRKDARDGSLLLQALQEEEQAVPFASKLDNAHLGPALPAERAHAAQRTLSMSSVSAARTATMAAGAGAATTVLYAQAPVLHPPAELQFEPEQSAARSNAQQHSQQPAYSSLVGAAEGYSMEIAEVDQRIEVLDAEIDQIRSQQREGWLQEVATMRDAKRQLRERRRVLRELEMRVLRSVIQT